MAHVVAPIPTIPAITEPSHIKWALPSAVSETWNPGAPVSTCRLPGGRGIMVANGIDPLRHVIDTTVYRTGIHAPEIAPASTQAANHANATLDLDDDGAGGSAEHTIVDGNLIWLGPVQVDNGHVIEFVDTLSASPTYNEVRIGSDNEETLKNFRSLIEGVEGDGTRWQSGPGQSVAVIQALVEVTEVTSSTLSVRAAYWGEQGNDYYAHLAVSGWSNASFGASASVYKEMTGGANGTSGGPDAGTYRYFYTYVRTADGAESGPSPKTTIRTMRDDVIDIGVSIVTEDADVDFVRIYRTESNGKDFFRVGEVAAVGSSATFSDDVANGIADGAIQSYGNVPYDEGAHRSYFEGHPPRCRFVARWKGMVWGGGAFIDADYSAGTANVTESSTSVVLSTLAVAASEMQGQTFQVDGDAVEYQILKVVESSRTLTLDRPYEESTDTTASYTIRDRRDPNQAYHSESNLPNQWHLTNNPGGVEPDDDDEGMTGMMATRDALVMWSRTGMWRITGEDKFSFSIHRVTGGKGCIGVPPVEINGVIYWVGPDFNVYGWDGYSVPRSVSTPTSSVDDATPAGIDRTMARVNNASAHRGHSYYCPRTKTLRFNLPMDGSAVPNLAPVWDVGRPGAWTLDTLPSLTSSAGVTDRAGAPACLAGDLFGNVWHMDVGAAGNVDGFFGASSVLSVAAGSTARLIELDSSAPTGDLTGTPFLWISAAGVVERGVLEDGSGTSLSLMRDLSGVPADGDQVVIGGMFSQAYSGNFLPGDSWNQTGLRDIQVLHAYQAGDQTYYLSTKVDGDADFAVPTGGDNLSGALSTPERNVRFRDDRWGFAHAVQLAIVTPGVTDGALLGYILGTESRS